MRFKNRQYRSQPRTREGRLLEELASCYGHDFPGTFSESDLRMDADPNTHLAYQDDFITDVCDGPHILDVDLLQHTGAQTLVREYCVSMKPRSSLTDSSIQYVHDGGEQLSVGVFGVI